jgi:hypothetical protein
MNDEILNELCPINPSFFSSNDYALIYISNGTLKCENEIFKLTGIGAIKLENAIVEIKTSTFIDPLETNVLLDGSLNIITCSGNSNLEIINPTINEKYEAIC